MTERFSEKYLKNLFGHETDIEDALKRLDFLTQEEAQMAAAQVLKATHAVDDTGRLRSIADIALSIDNRVGGVNDQVQGVDDKVTAVVDGAQYIFYLLSWIFLTHDVPRWKRGPGTHSTDGRRRRSSETFVIS